MKSVHFLLLCLASPETSNNIWERFQKLKTILPEPTEKNLEMDQRTILFQFPRMYFFLSKYYCFLHSLCHCHCLPIGFTKCLSWSNSGCSIYFVIVRQLCPTVMHRLNHHLSHVSKFHLKLPSQTEFAFQCNV